MEGNLNTLSVIDLDKYPLEYINLSKNLSTPTPRSNHGMEVYDNSLYIFGGVNNEGDQYELFRLLDMWSYNLDLVKWSPVQIQSTVIPQPRSDFAHSRLDEYIVLFGGKGNASQRSLLI
jgi:N-acetylneuraminic acid mutarotase